MNNAVEEDVLEQERGVPEQGIANLVLKGKPTLRLGHATATRTTGATWRLRLMPQVVLVDVGSATLGRRGDRECPAQVLPKDRGMDGGSGGPGKEIVRSGQAGRASLESAGRLIPELVDRRAKGAICSFPASIYLAERNLGRSLF